MKFAKLCILLSAFSLLFTACENGNENLVQERGTNVSPVVSGIKPAVFTTDLDSYVKFYVSLPDGESVDKGYVEVGVDSTIAEVEEISSFPDSVTLKLSDVATALGLSSVETGTVFNVYITTEKDGRKTRSLTGSFQVSVVCAFDEALTIGSYAEESTDWGVAGNVTMTADSSDPYTIYISGMQSVEGLTTQGTSTPVTIYIDPDSYAITGGSTIFAPNLSDFGSSYASYTNYTFTVSSGTYTPCDGMYSIKFKITVDQGSFGTYSFTFSRKDS